MEALAGKALLSAASSSTPVAGLGGGQPAGAPQQLPGELQAGAPAEGGNSNSVILIALLVSVILVSVVGNCLVCVAIFTDRRLRKLGNAFIVSLAIADLFVSCLVMTFALCNDLMNRWIFGDWFCDLWISFDIMCCTASILNLCAISLDRFVHIKDCLLYDQWMTRRVAISAVIIIWFISALVSFVPINLGWHRPAPGAGQRAVPLREPAWPIATQPPPITTTATTTTRTLATFVADERSAFVLPARPLDPGALDGPRQRLSRSPAKGVEEPAAASGAEERRPAGKLNYSSPLLWARVAPAPLAADHKRSRCGQADGASGAIENQSSLNTIRPASGPALVASAGGRRAAAQRSSGPLIQMEGRGGAPEVPAGEGRRAPASQAAQFNQVESNLRDASGRPDERGQSRRRAGRLTRSFAAPARRPDEIPARRGPGADSPVSLGAAAAAAERMLAISQVEGPASGAGAAAAGAAAAAAQSAPQCVLTLTPTYAVVSSAISFYIPCIIMLGLYTKLFACARYHVRNIRAVSKAPTPIARLAEPAPVAGGEGARPTRTWLQLTGRRAPPQRQGQPGGSANRRGDKIRRSSGAGQCKLGPLIAAATAAAAAAADGQEQQMARRPEARPFLGAADQHASGQASDVSELAAPKPAAKVSWAGAGKESAEQQAAAQGCKLAPGAGAAGGSQLATHKAAVTLGIIMGTFLFCWVPFFCLNIIKAFCVDCIPSSLFRAFTWLGYANSALNPIIYGIHNSEFRHAFNRIFFKHLNIKNSRYYLNRRQSHDLRRQQNPRLAELGQQARR